MTDTNVDSTNEDRLEYIKLTFCEEERWRYPDLGGHIWEPMDWLISEVERLREEILMIPLNQSNDEHKLREAIRSLTKERDEWELKARVRQKQIDSLQSQLSSLMKCAEQDEDSIETLESQLSEANKKLKKKYYCQKCWNVTGIEQ